MVKFEEKTNKVKSFFIELYVPCTIFMHCIKRMPRKNYNRQECFIGKIVFSKNERFEKKQGWVRRTTTLFFSKKERRTTAHNWPIGEMPNKIFYIFDDELGTSPSGLTLQETLTQHANKYFILITNLLKKTTTFDIT